MNLGVKRLAILLGVVGAYVGFAIARVEFDNAVVDNFYEHCLFTIVGFLISFGGVHAVYWGGRWVAMGFTQSRTKRRKEKEPETDKKE